MNRGELKTMVLQRLRIDPSETGRVTQIEATLNQEWLRVAARLGLNVTQTGLDFTAGTPTVSLPNDFLEILDVYRATTGSSGTWAGVLQPLSVEAFAALQAGAAAGLQTTPTGPVYYLLEGTQTTQPVLRFWPTPTTTTTLGSGFTVRYKRRVTKLTSDSASDATGVPLALPEEFHDLLGELTISVVGAEQGAWEVVTHARDRANEILMELEMNVMQRPGPVSTRVPLRGYGRGY